jgi:hypothetical protein
VVLHYAPPDELSDAAHEALFDGLDERLLRDLRNFKAYIEGMPERIVGGEGARVTSTTT